MSFVSLLLRPALGVLLMDSMVMAQSVALTPRQQSTLRELVKNDKNAARQFAKVKAEADEALTARPDPVTIIESEGRLKSDPGKISTLKSLKDMPKAEALGWAFAVTGEARYSGKAKEFVLAWAQVNEPQGDPINETKLEPILTAYDLTQAVFSGAEKASVETWLRKIAGALIEHQKKKGKATSFNNWHSHRLKMLGLCGWLLRDSPLIESTLTSYREQIANNLQPDGSSFDFHERDALHYHCYDLEPLLILATVARQQGVSIDFFHFTGPNGASLKKAVEFLVPYCDGTKTHSEYVNSKVEFDRKRAAAGQAEFAIGHAFDPKDALETLEMAGLFEEPFAELAAQIRGKKTAKYGSWQLVLNEARR